MQHLTKSNDSALPGEPSGAASRLWWWWLPKRRPSRCGHPLSVAVAARKAEGRSFCDARRNTQLSTQGAIGKHRLDVAFGLAFKHTQASMDYDILCYVYSVHAMPWLSKQVAQQIIKSFWKKSDVKGNHKCFKCRISKRSYHQQFHHWHTLTMFLIHGSPSTPPQTCVLELRWEAGPKWHNELPVEILEEVRVAESSCFAQFEITVNFTGYQHDSTWFQLPYMSHEIHETRFEFPWAQT